MRTGGNVASWYKCLRRQFNPVIRCTEVCQHEDLANLLPGGKKKAKLAAAIKIPTMRSLWKLSSGCTLNERPIQRNIIQLSKDDKNQWIHAGCPPLELVEALRDGA